MNTQAIITKAVCNYMKRERYNQTAIARLLEMNQTTVSKKILGSVRWTMEDLDRLTVLGIIEPVTAFDVTDWANHE